MEEGKQEKKIGWEERGWEGGSRGNCVSGVRMSCRLELIRGDLCQGVVTEKWEELDRRDKREREIEGRVV